MSITLAERIAFPAETQGQLAPPSIEAIPIAAHDPIQGQLEVAGADITYTITGPRNPDSSVARLWIPGYLGVACMYSEVIAEASKNDTNIQFDISRHQKNHPLAGVINPNKLLAQAAGAVARDVRKVGIEQVDVAGHSNGGNAGANMTAYASEKYPGLVRSFLSIAGAGASGHSVPKLAVRTLGIYAEMLEHGGMYNARPEDDPHILRNQLAHHIGAAPLRTIMEGIHCANGGTAMLPHLVTMQQNNVLSAGLYWRRDRYFPARLAARYAGDLFDVFQTGSPDEAGHFAPQFYAKEVAEQVKDISEQLGLE